MGTQSAVTSLILPLTHNPPGAAWVLPVSWESSQRPDSALLGEKWVGQQTKMTQWRESGMVCPQSPWGSSFLEPPTGWPPAVVPAVRDRGRRTVIPVLSVRTAALWEIDVAGGVRRCSANLSRPREAKCYPEKSFALFWIPKLGEAAFVGERTTFNSVWPWPRDYGGAEAPMAQ